MFHRKLLTAQLCSTWFIWLPLILFLCTLFYISASQLHILLRVALLYHWKALAILYPAHVSRWVITYISWTFSVVNFLLWHLFPVCVFLICQLYSCGAHLHDHSMVLNFGTIVLPKSVRDRWIEYMAYFAGIMIISLIFIQIICTYDSYCTGAKMVGVLSVRIAVK